MKIKRKDTKPNAANRYLYAQATSPTTQAHS